jgi:hypothetical protein
VQNTELERSLADARNKVEATATDVVGVVQERDQLMNNLLRMQVTDGARETGFARPLPPTPRTLRPILSPISRAHLSM